MTTPSSRGTASPAHVPSDARRAASDAWPSIADSFASRIADDVAVGSFVALFDGEGELASGGFGARRLGGRVPDADTVFRIASCTKSFTAAAILQLRDQGRLQLDTPITRFVPEFHAEVLDPTDGILSAPVGPPTVRMLLCMSGGLPTDDPWADRQESITSAELRTILEAGTPLSSMPGTAYEYSNLGYALLGQVIESVTGRPYVEVITAELLEPLGLTSTTFDALAVDDDRRAVGYRRSGDAWLELPFSSPGAFSPIGGVCTSARDLIRWSSWLASGFSCASGPSTPLSASSRREMQQIQRTIPIPEPATTQDSEDAGNQPRIVANGYGFGLFLRDDDRHGLSASHPGGYPGFSSNMRWNPRTGIGVVAFENATYAGVGTAAAPALSMVLDEVGHTQPSTPWQRTRECMAVADRLIDAWDDRLAARYLAENVALDSPFAERSEAIAAARDAVGGLMDGTGTASAALDADGENGTASAALVPGGVSGTSPAHIVWYRTGRSGRLRCELRLAPVNPPLIQTFTVTAEVAADTSR